MSYVGPDISYTRSTLHKQILWSGELTSKAVSDVKNFVLLVLPKKNTDDSLYTLTLAHSIEVINNGQKNERVHHNLNKTKLVSRICLGLSTLFT